MTEKHPTAAPRSPIVQKALPLRPWAEEKTRRLPGLNPVAPGEWLLRDDAFAGQMAYRDTLIAERREKVIALAAQATPAAQELLAAVLAEIAGVDGYEIGSDRVRRPDGVLVPLERDDPLATAGRLVQEDLVIMEKPEGGEEHLLTGAVLCFPASWTLDEKYLRPLTGIHVPVPVYDDEIARRVQRLFDGLQIDRPIWRANFLPYADPDLHQPRRETERRERPKGEAEWLRVERQALRRLPATRAVIFSIHTYVVPMTTLSADDRAELAAVKPVA